MRKKRQSRFPDTATLFNRLALVVCCTAIVIGLFLFLQTMREKGALVKSSPREEVEAMESICVFRRALDGVCVEKEEYASPPLVGIMIDNHMDARPQSGLAEARVVYEAPVEGNFTRFLTLFLAEDEVKKAGPVRSARPYYLDWLLEYPGTPYFHVGGSDDALEVIRRLDIVNFNEFYYGGTYFWRSNGRKAPYNTYTSQALWQKAREETERRLSLSATTTPWQFEEAMEPCVSPNPVDECVPEIQITFLPNSFDVVWRYDVETGRYRRDQAGEPHLDEDGEQIKAETVIVQHIKTQTLDAVGRLSMETIGSGAAIVFRDGHAIVGTWKKQRRTARTHFFALDGNEIPFKSGKIWIEVVNGRGKVEF